MFSIFTLPCQLRERGFLVGLPTLLIVRLCAVLLLVTIGLQSASPIGPVDQSPSSAFSAAAHEVALAPRQEVRAATSIAPLPLIPVRVTLRTRTILLVEDSAAPRLRAQIPAVSILAFRPGPRAPPFA